MQEVQAANVKLQELDKIYFFIFKASLYQAIDNNPAHRDTAQRAALLSAQERPTLAKAILPRAEG